MSDNTSGTGRQSSLGAQTGTLSDLAEELVYTPTATDRKLKGAFLAAIQDNPLIDLSTITSSEIERILKRKLVNKDKPGFKEWFLNQDENRHRLEYLFDLALQAAEDILMNQEPKAQSARVNMVKVVSELASKYPKNTVSPNANGMISAIGSMDKVQLKALLQSRGQSIQIEASKGTTGGLSEGNPEDVIDSEPDKV